MNAFQDIIGRRITEIHRVDTQDDYEFYSPYALVLTIDGLNEKLILTATNDGTSSDVRLSNDQDIEDDFGLEFHESVLNALKPEDELNGLRNQTINEIRIAEFVDPEIKGNGFLIKQGKVAGVELKTDKHHILFHNNYGGWVDIDDEEAKLPNNDRWKWK